MASVMLARRASGVLGRVSIWSKPTSLSHKPNFHAPFRGMSFSLLVERSQARPSRATQRLLPLTHGLKSLPLTLPVVTPSTAVCQYFPVADGAVSAVEAAAISTGRALGSVALVAPTE